jgi:hypothetical protein
MIRRSLFAALALAPLLSGCGIPDLVAHGVKAAENSHDRARAKEAAPPASAAVQPVSARPVAEEPPPPVVAPMPRHSSVTVEALPDTVESQPER